MDRFVSALSRRDLGKLLSCFSRTAPWILVTTEHDDSPVRHGRRKTNTFSYNELSRGMRAGGDFAEFFFDEDDPFVHFVEATQGRPWRDVDGVTFVPPTKLPLNPPVFVRWRIELGRYVIDEIGTPIS